MDIVFKTDHNSIYQDVWRYDPDFLVFYIHAFLPGHQHYYKFQHINNSRQQLLTSFLNQIVRKPSFIGRRR